MAGATHTYEENLAAAEQHLARFASEPLPPRACHRFRR